MLNLHKKTIQNPKQEIEYRKEILLDPVNYSTSKPVLCNYIKRNDPSTTMSTMFTRRHSKDISFPNSKLSPAINSQHINKIRKTVKYIDFEDCLNANKELIRKTCYEKQNSRFLTSTLKNTNEYIDQISERNHHRKCQLSKIEKHLNIQEKVIKITKQIKETTKAHKTNKK